ncbi:MAG: hypothetical protein J6A52_02455 [Bacilli bacterium]|nr:hypothetical protein [Bacilli bacterium]
MKNNKGFVLVETIVTAVFVLGLFSFLITNILPLIGDFERMMDYDSIESKYDAHLIRKMILKDSNSCRIENLITLSSREYYEFEGTDLCLYLSNVNYCQKLLSSDFLDVKKIVLTKYDVSSLKNKSDSFERALSEYIDYMPKYNNTSATHASQYFYKRRLIVYFNDGRITNVELLLDGDVSAVCGGATC